MTEQDTVAVIVAAGQGTRMGAKHNKLLLPLGTRTILEIGLETFIKASQNPEDIFDRFLTGSSNI